MPEVLDRCPGTLHQRGVIGIHNVSFIGNECRIDPKEPFARSMDRSGTWM